MGSLARSSGGVHFWRREHPLVALLRRLVQTGAGAGGIALFGAVIGLMVAVLPLRFLYVPIVVLVLMAALVLWAMPDLRRVPSRLTRWAFFVFLPVLACVPPYMAIDPPALPWISLTRVALFSLILLFLMVLAGSSDARGALRATLRGGGVASVAFYAVAFTFFLSIFLSNSSATSLKAYADAAIYWFIPFLATLLVVRSHRDVQIVYRLLAASAIFLLAIAAVEFVWQQRVFLRILPGSLIASDPVMYEVLSRANFRNGIYRVSASFLVPLSYAEFLALISPVFLYMVLYGEKLVWRSLGVLAFLAASAGIVLSGSRGGLISYIVACALFVFLYAVRAAMRRKGSLIGPFLLSLYAVGSVMFVGLVFTWRRLYVMIFGGGEAAGSTEARIIQWDMATPHIMANPVTGHGLGLGAATVGFTTPAGTLTLDSYAITLLVETGILGFAAFFLLVLGTAAAGARAYLKHPEDRAAPVLPLACGLAGFAIYRMALSQTENHTILFVFVGIVAAIVARLKHEAAERNAAEQARKAAEHRARVDRLAARRLASAETLFGHLPKP